MDSRITKCCLLNLGAIFLLLAGGTIDVRAESGAESLFDLSLSDLLNVRVVTAASGFEQNPEDAPASVTVINAEEWQSAGATTLFEALRGVPGLHVSLVQTGVAYEKPILRGLSGTFGQQVLLLVDGTPFRSVREGGAPWAAYMSLESFKRIEVIRGSGSAIYGADAVGGIINLVSYDAGEVPSRVTLAAGENGYHSLQASGSLTGENQKFHFTLSSLSSDGDPERVIDVDAQSFFDLGFGTSASHAPGAMDTDFDAYMLRGQWQWRNWSVSYTDWNGTNIGTGAGFAQALDPEGTTKLRTQLIQLDYDFSNWVPGDLRLRTSWQKVRARSHTVLFPAGTELNILPDGNIAPVFQPNPNFTQVTFTDGVIGNPGNDNNVFSIQLNHIFDVSENHKIRWAIGGEKTDSHVYEEKNFGPGVWDGATTVDGAVTNVTGTEYAYLPNVDRELQYVSVQDQWTLSENLVATLGLRYDHYSDFGSTTNPRLGLVWQANKSTTFKAFVGSAFRAPSFVDLYAKNNPAGIGNPDLDPESVNLVDLGFAANYVFSDQLQLETSIFQYSADKLIAFVSTPGGQRAENSGELDVRGIEQLIVWQPRERLNIDASFTVIDPYETTLVDTSAIPQQLGSINVNYRQDHVHWYLGGRWVAGRERSPQDPRDDIDDYTWVTARAEAFIGNWQASLMIDNLFDTDAREPSTELVPNDYPLAGREFRVQIARQF